MVEQQKLLRVLKMINMLKDSPKHITYLMDRLKISKRTVNRYINLLDAVGFIIDKDFNNKYFIHKDETDKRIWKKQLK